MYSERRKEGADSGDVATAVILVLVSAAVAWLLPRDQANPEIGLRAVRQSRYAELRVLDTAAGRHLLIDGGVHTIVDPAGWQQGRQCQQLVYWKRRVATY